MISSRNYLNDEVYLWILISLTGKVSYYQIIDLSSNTVYTKNQLVS
jgi:hypothetical protein